VTTTSAAVLCPCCNKPLVRASGNVEPFCKRPDAIAKMPAEAREKYCVETDDYCRLQLQNASPRVFVRGVVPFAVTGRAQPLRWGLWAEVPSHDDFLRILDLHADPDQHRSAPIDALLANRVFAYDESTLGLSCRIQLVSPRQRPTILLDAESDHPFVREQLEGVEPHRVEEWLAPFFGAA